MNYDGENFMRKNIFGYDVYINNDIDGLFFENEFEMYKDNLNDLDKKLIINISESKTLDYLSSNPKLILVDRDGFTMKSKVNIKWNFSNSSLGEIVVEISISKNKKGKVKQPSLYLIKSLVTFVILGFIQTHFLPLDILG